ncbi:MAG: hypothetical protein IH597_03245 [Bacteroidales bacterium]|nr:hypothetical protein [Bacteroidales bacterium]
MRKQKSNKRILLFIFTLLLSVSSLNAQHIIRYEMDDHNAENCKVLFIDTLSNEVTDSFYLHERNPYWNLPYDTIETGNYSVKTYKFNNIDSLTKDEIPGLIAYGPANISKYPGEALAFHGARVSTNGQFIAIYNRLTLYVYSDNDFTDHASQVVVYDVEGKIHNSFYSEALNIEDIYITDDGNYYLVWGWMQSVKVSDGILSLYKIIDIKNNQTIITVNTNDENFSGGYGKIDGNYICIMLDIRNQDDPYGPSGQGFLRCYDLVNNMVYTTSVDQKSKCISMFKGITDEGVKLKSLLGKDVPDRLLRFDKDFTKLPIR